MDNKKKPEVFIGTYALPALGIQDAQEGIADMLAEGWEVMDISIVLDRNGAKDAHVFYRRG